MTSTYFAAVFEALAEDFQAELDAVDQADAIATAMFGPTVDPRQEDAQADYNIVNAPSLMTTQDWRNAGMDIEYPETLDAEAEDYAQLNRERSMDAMEARGGPEYRVADTDDLPF